MAHGPKIIHGTEVQIDAISYLIKYSRVNFEPWNCQFDKKTHRRVWSLKSMEIETFRSNGSGRFDWSDKVIPLHTKLILT